MKRAESTTAISCRWIDTPPINISMLSCIEVVIAVTIYTLISQADRVELILTNGNFDNG